MLKAFVLTRVNQNGEIPPGMVFTSNQASIKVGEPINMNAGKNKTTTNPVKSIELFTDYTLVTTASGSQYKVTTE